MSDSPKIRYARTEDLYPPANLEPSHVMDCGHELRHWTPHEGTIIGAIKFRHHPEVYGFCEICREVFKTRRAIVLAILRDMSASERSRVFGKFCRHCGDADPRCQCWNDE